MRSWIDVRFFTRAKRKYHLIITCDVKNLTKFTHQFNQYNEKFIAPYTISPVFVNCHKPGSR